MEKKPIDLKQASTALQLAQLADTGRELPDIQVKAWLHLLMQAMARECVEQLTPEQLTQALSAARAKQRGSYWRSVPPPEVVLREALALLGRGPSSGAAESLRDTRTSAADTRRQWEESGTREILGSLMGAGERWALGEDHE